MKETREVVVRSLAAFGWSPSDGSAIASKTYETAVGDKVAHVFLADFGPASSNLMLQGDYRSEGRNILESSSVLLPKDAPDGVLAGLVEKFAHGCDKGVSESYAAGLLSKQRERAMNVQTAPRDAALPPEEAKAFDAYIVAEGFTNISRVAVMEAFLLRAAERYHTLRAETRALDAADEDRVPSYAENKLFTILSENFDSSVADLRVFFSETDDFREQSVSERVRLAGVADMLVGSARSPIRIEAARHFASEGKTDVNIFPEDILLSEERARYPATAKWFAEFFLTNGDRTTTDQRGLKPLPTQAAAEQFQREWRAISGLDLETGEPLAAADASVLSSRPTPAEDTGLSP